MGNKIIQCCYTNASTEVAGKISSGWQPVAVSPDIAPTAYNKCTEMQSVNSSIENAMVDENGEILNLYEIAGDGNYVYILRTQYGLLDRLGRANMFSHAYILPWDENDVLSDPNILLTIANENFKSELEEAEKFSEELIRTESMNIEDAMHSVGLNNETYALLIQCVYTQMTEQKIRDPLYIQYDGTEKQMKEILYCVYYALPFYLRKTLHIASAKANKPSDKNIIFSKFAREHTYYFIPETGENNILTSRISKKIARYGFVDYVAQKIGEIDVDVYYRKLEHLIALLGASSVTNELILKIAHQFMLNSKIDSFGNVELEERLSDALRAKVYGSQYMDSYIAAMLKEVYNRKLVLSNENEEYLAGYLSNTKTEKLLLVGEMYNIYRFSSLPESEAAQKLNLMSKNIFSTYSKQLSSSEKGCRILDYYYSEIRLAKKEISWEDLKEIYKESELITKRPKTIDKLTYLALELYTTALHNRKEKSEIQLVYQNYIQFMEMMLDADAMRKCIQSAKEEFWETVEISTISYGLLPLYTDMDIDNGKCKQVFELLELEKTLRVDNEIVFLNKLAKSYKKIISGSNRIENEAIEQKIMRIVRINYQGQDTYFAEWCKLFTKFSSDEMTSSILLIRDILKVKKYGEFIEEYNFLKKLAREERVYENLIPALYKLLREIFEKEDGKCENGIPLDVWLCIANNMHQNSFEIFDIIKPKVLQRDSMLVVEESTFLQKGGFVTQGEQYICNKGTEAKIVKKWLADLKRQSKETHGLFNHGLSVFSKLTQNEEKVESKKEIQTKPIHKTTNKPINTEVTKSESKGLLKGLFKNK